MKSVHEAGGRGRGRRWVEGVGGRGGGKGGGGGDLIGLRSEERKLDSSATSDESTYTNSTVLLLHCYSKLLSSCKTTRLQNHVDMKGVMSYQAFPFFICWNGLSILIMKLVSAVSRETA